MVEIKVVTKKKHKDTREKFKPLCLEDKGGKIISSKILLDIGQKSKRRGSAGRLRNVEN